ncbi:MAG: sugar phosphate isomerase/epimerase [Spirochaetales bacterium]|nr:sugar phosphate isomerase/epimerase [Spirochaetales bacterium]
MKIYSSLGPFKEQVFGGSIRSFAQIADKLKIAGLDGIEINSIIFEKNYQNLLPFNFNFRGIDYSMVTLHSNYQDCNLGSANSFTRNAGIEQVVDEYEFAENNGVRIVTIHPGRVKGIPREAAMGLLWNSLSDIYKRIEQSETKLCIENMDNKQEKLCNRLSEIEKTLSKFPDLGLTVDFAHLGLNNENIGMFVEKFKSRICHIHISGVKKGYRHGDVSLSRSEIDFMPFLTSFVRKNITAVIENNRWDDVIESKKVLEGLENKG